jgi:hypothetical protein
MHGTTIKNIYIYIIRQCSLRNKRKYQTRRRKYNIFFTRWGNSLTSYETTSFSRKTCVLISTCGSVLREMVYACEALWKKKISKKVKKKYSKGSKQKAFALLCIQEGKQHKEYYIMKLFFSLVFLLLVKYDCRNNVHHTYKHTTVPLLYMLLYSDSSLFLIHHPHFSCRKGFFLGNVFPHLFP